MKKSKGGVMRGSKIDDKTKETALAMLATNCTLTKVAAELNIPLTTISSWKKEAEKDENFVEVRNKNKERFINEAWDVITNSLLLMSKRVERALKNEEEFEELQKQLTNAEISNEEKKKILNKLSKLKIEDISKLSSIVGVLYDKQALINNESTANVKDLTIEDYLKKCVTKDDY